MDVLQEATQVDLKLSDNIAAGVLSCQVVEADEDSTVLELPEEAKLDSTLFIEVGAPVEFSVYTMTGISFYQASVKKHLEEGFLAVENIKRFHQVQRREFFRTSILRPLEISYFDGTKTVFVKGTSIDLSGGGVRFSTDQHVRSGFLGNISIFLDCCDQPIRAKGRIIYTKNVEKKESTRKHYIGVFEFINIDEEQLQVVMQTCFRQQIEAKKKGLL